MWVLLVWVTMAWFSTIITHYSLINSYSMKWMLHREMKNSPVYVSIFSSCLFLEPSQGIPSHDRSSHLFLSLRVLILSFFSSLAHSVSLLHWQVASCSHHSYHTHIMIISPSAICSVWPNYLLLYFDPFMNFKFLFFTFTW